MAEAAKPIPNPETAAGSAGYDRFLVLDGLRGIAAFAVILDHVASTTLRSWFPGRYLAVDFFFVLSGFVLAHAYGKRLREGQLSVGAFLKVRMIRLYPLYLLGLAIAMLPLAIGFLKGWGNPAPEVMLVAAAALLFLPFPPVFGWTGDNLYPLNGPAWSLFFELIANVVYAAIARFLSLRVFAVMLPILAAATAFTVLRHTETEGPGWLWSHFDAGLARVLFDFFAGVAIYRLREIQIQKGRPGLPAIPAWLGVAVLIAIFAVPATGIWRQVFDALAAIVLMPLLVALVSGAKVNGRLAQLCGLLGTLSYGVYILHVPLLGLITFILSFLHIQLPYGFLTVLLVALVAAGTAALAHYVYDTPVRRWLMRALSSPAKPRQPHLTAGEAG